MTYTRRDVLKSGLFAGVAASTAALWSNRASAEALAQFSMSDYKAVVVVSLVGGNDANNTVVPLDNAGYAAYNQMRPSIAISKGSLRPLLGSSNQGAYGLHPSLANIAALYNSNRAAVIANVGPLAAPTTKNDVLNNTSLYPGASLNHTIGVQLWESSEATTAANTGWGGRAADYLMTSSGALPPVLSTGGRTLFTVGKAVQAVAVQSGSAFPALPPGLNTTIQRIADSEVGSSNQFVQQVASLRSQATSQQVLIDQASSYQSIATHFDTVSPFSQAMFKIAQVLAGRSVLGASRQIFYVQQGNHDTHQNQVSAQAANLLDLDLGIGYFFNALNELGLSNQVLVCTHSDFGRTMQANVNGGTDHAWGSHHFMLGGGINGGRVLGTMPELTLGGSSDLNGQGIWVPTQSVTQMTAAIGKWLGLTAPQVADVFPDLQNFSSGALQI